MARAAPPQRWTFDFWTKVVPILISACALGLTFYTAWLQRDMQRRSTRAYISISDFHNQRGSGFIMGNGGVGAAYLHWFQILVDNRPQPDWRAMTTALGGNINVPFEFARPSYVWQPGSSARVYWASPGELDTLLQTAVVRVDFKFCYCSILDYCWIGSFRYAPKEVKTCPAAPAIRYGGADEPPANW